MSDPVSPRGVSERQITEPTVPPKQKTLIEKYVYSPMSTTWNHKGKILIGAIALSGTAYVLNKKYNVVGKVVSFTINKLFGDKIRAHQEFMREVVNDEAFLVGMPTAKQYTVSFIREIADATDVSKVVEITQKGVNKILESVYNSLPETQGLEVKKILSPQIDRFFSNSLDLDKTKKSRYNFASTVISAFFGIYKKLGREFIEKHELALEKLNLVGMIVEAGLNRIDALRAMQNIA